MWFVYAELFNLHINLIKTSCISSVFYICNNTKQEITTCIYRTPFMSLQYLIMIAPYVLVYLCSFIILSTDYSVTMMVPLW